MNNSKYSNSNALWAGLILGVGILAYFVIAGYNETRQNWVVLAVLGVSIFLILLTFMSFVFTAVKIGNKNEALGLPPGSIRAVIALCLVVVFVIFVVFLYGDLANPPPGRSLVNISQEQYNKISPEVMFSSNVSDNKTGQTLYDVELIGIPKSQAAQDLAKQIITLVGTLMAAVSSFYFGVKAGEGKETKDSTTGDAKEDKGQSALSLSSPTSPTTLDPNNKTLQIKLNSGKGEEIEAELPVGDSGGKVEPTKPGEFLYTRGSKPDVEVFLLFRLIKHPETIATLLVETPNLVVSNPTTSLTMATKKGSELTIQLKVNPKGEDVKWDPPVGDSDGSIKQMEPGVFKYIRGTKAEPTVTINFHLVSYPHVTCQASIAAT
jgi:hypothetical protein